MSRNAFGMGLVATFVLGAATIASAQSHAFSFRSIEFLPREQRAAAAQQFLEAFVAPGTPMLDARANLRRSGAYCIKSRLQPGGLQCDATSMQRHPGEDLTDIDWKIQVYPNPDGTVNHATVQRIRSGL